MEIKTIHAPGAPAAVGPYSHAVLAGLTLYTSGQIGLDPKTNLLADGIYAQAEQALNNLGAVLAAAGMHTDDVVKTTVFLADMHDFALINDLYAAFFQENKPARSCVQAAALPKGALFEIECIAIRRE